MLFLQISLLYLEVAYARMEAERQLFILNQKIGHRSNNIMQLTNRPAFMCRTNGFKKRQTLRIKANLNQKTILELQWRLHLL